MNISFCKHSFPVQPPHGTLAHPGNCTGCGTAWNVVQDDLREQEARLLVGSSRDGHCTDCRRAGRLFRFQPAGMPWHEVDVELPVTWLCMDCWNGARDTEAAFNSALIDVI